MKKNLLKCVVTAFFAVVVISMTACSTASGSGSSSASSSSASKYLDCKYGLLDEFKDKDVVAWFMWDNVELSHYTMQKAFIFFDDNTYCVSDREGGSKIEIEGEYKGTYTGDPSKDGKVVLTRTHYVYNDGGNKIWNEYSFTLTYDFVIENDAYKVEYGNGAFYYYRQ